MSLGKKIFSLLLLLAIVPLLGLPAAQVKAQTTDNQSAVRSELRSLINELRIIRAALNELLARIRGGSATLQEKQKAETLKVTLVRTVKIMAETYKPGDKGADILELQKFLNENPYTQIVPASVARQITPTIPVSSVKINTTVTPNTPGAETGIYDTATSDALRRYQELLSVVSVADLVNKYKIGQLKGASRPSFIDFAKGFLEETWDIRKVFAADIFDEAKEAALNATTQASTQAGSAGQDFGGKVVEICGPTKCKYIQEGTDCSKNNPLSNGYTSFKITPTGQADPFVTHKQGTTAASCSATPVAEVNIVGSVNEGTSITLNTSRDESNKCNGVSWGAGKVIVKCSNTFTAQSGNQSANNANNFSNACRSAIGSSCPSCGGSSGASNMQSILGKLLGSSNASSLLSSLTGSSGSSSDDDEDEDDEDEDTTKKTTGSTSTSTKATYGIKFRFLTAQAMTGPLNLLSGPAVGAIAVYDRSTTDSTYDPGMVGVCIDASCTRIITSNYKNNKYQTRNAPSGREVTYFQAPGA